MPTPTTPAWIWTDPVGAGRNRYALFRRTFDLPAGATQGVLNLFVDTRYRLVVNGRTLGHGPARFFLRHPEYDTHDLSPHLRAGRNVIAVTVNSVGANHFQGEQSTGGLIAWGEAGEAGGVDLSTGPAWRAIDDPARARETHALSFAVGPAERLDLRAVPTGWESPDFVDAAWPPAVTVADVSRYGRLTPRSIPPLDEREVAPLAITRFAGRPRHDEDVYSLSLAPSGGRGIHTQAVCVLATHIHSPRDQDVVIGGWWGRWFVNGEPVTASAKHDDQRRHDIPVRLRAGWNTLVVAERIHWSLWEQYLRLPRSAGLTVSADRRHDDDAVFLVAGPWEGAAADLAATAVFPPPADLALPAALGDWRRWPRGRGADSPHRERAALQWRPLAEGESPDPADTAVMHLVDFGTAVLGRPVVEFGAAPGATVDLTYSEQLNPDGTGSLVWQHFVDMAERFTVAGPGAIHTFHPRGLRYLEVIASPAGGFTLGRVALTRANYPVDNVGRFECSDPALNELWLMGRRTEHACMEDAFLDCPLRERGLYAGDFYVQFFTTLACYGDTALFRRCIALFFHSAETADNGLVAGGAHGLPPGRHPDYSAIMLPCLRAYWDRTGDDTFLAEMAPAAHRVLARLDAETHAPTRLIDGERLGHYVDLGRLDKRGVNAPVNMLMAKAFIDGAWLASRLGDSVRAAAHERRADELVAAINTHFWDDARGAYVDRLRTDAADTTPSVHGNALAILFDIAPPDRARRAARVLADLLADNHYRHSTPPRNDDFHVQSYFTFFAIGALARAGLDAEAVDFMRTAWRPMLDAHAATAWEYFLPTASLCHAWSTAPNHYLSTHVLGVEFPRPGDMSVVRIAPHPGGLAWAAGVYPHPAGPIEISWRRQPGGDIVTRYRVPAGVSVVD